MKNDNPFYVCKDWYLFVYTTKENAITARRIGATSAAGVTIAAGPKPTAFVAKYWSKKLTARVAFVELKEPIFLIKKDEYDDIYWNVIIGERIGWIIVEYPIECSILTMENAHNQ